MKNFQKFIHTFLELKDTFEKHGAKNIDYHGKDKLIYKKAGITDPEKIRLLERQKTINMNMRIQESLGLVNHFGSVYELSEEIKRYLILNDAPDYKSVLNKLSLPFKAIFVETEITQDDFDIGVTAIKGILIAEADTHETDENGKEIYVGKMFIVYYFCEDIIEGKKVSKILKQELDSGKTPVTIVESDEFITQENGNIIQHFDKEDVEAFQEGNETTSSPVLRFYIDEFKIDFSGRLNLIYDDKKTLKFLKQFIVNLILFINDPEVEIVDFKRGDKNRERRLREGKMPLPDSKNIRLIGKLKVYLDSLHSHLSGTHYNYRFWVRGHYRTLRSERYKESKGKIIKIEPFVKGSGVLLQRNYSLNFEKDDERLKEMKKDNTFYEDIKPAEKSLRERRMKGEL